MTPKQKWTIALAFSFVFVAGYAVAVFTTVSKLQAAAERQKSRAREAESRIASQLASRIGQPLPAAKFVGPGEVRLADDAWRKGKVVLVLLTTACDACRVEGEFLRALAGQRSDVKFLGVLSFEQDERSLRSAQTIFPFPVVRDDRMELTRALGVTGVPIKIYLQDGVIRQSWRGATMDEGARARFTEWLLHV